MSILIKGMDMPTCCNNCWFYDDRRCYLFSYGVPNRYNYDVLTKPDWCELIELPPHGRLIDADALMELYEPAPEDVNEWEHYTTTISVIRQNIKDQPTIIEAEEGE